MVHFGGIVVLPNYNSHRDSNTTEMAQYTALGANVVIGADVNSGCSA
jgi:hypothetical protein